LTNGYSADYNITFGPNAQAEGKILGIRGQVKTGHLRIMAQARGPRKMAPVGPLKSIGFKKLAIAGCGFPRKYVLK